MLEIKKNQELEINSLFSFRGKIKQNEFEMLGKDMEEKIKRAGANQLGTPITATFGVEGDYLDVELLLPIDRKIESTDKYCYKEKLKIVNAIVAAYKGNPAGLQNACNEVNQYIMENGLQPVTVGYNMTKKVDPWNMENTEIDVYIGINPNIL